MLMEKDKKFLHNSIPKTFVNLDNLFQGIFNSN